MARNQKKEGFSLLKFIKKFIEGEKGEKGENVKLISKKEGLDPDRLSKGRSPKEDAKQCYKGINSIKLELNSNIINIVKNDNLTDKQKLQTLTEFKKYLGDQLDEFSEEPNKSVIKDVANLVEEARKDLEAGKEITPATIDKLGGVNSKLDEVRNVHLEKFLSRGEIGIINNVTDAANEFTKDFLNTKTPQEMVSVVIKYSNAVVEIDKSLKERLKYSENKEFVKNEVPNQLNSNLAVPKQINHAESSKLRQSNTNSIFPPDGTPNQTNTQEIIR